MGVTMIPVEERKNQLDFLTEDPNKYLITYLQLLDDPDGMKYQATNGPYWYYSEKYDEWLKIDDKDKFDGASGTVDIHSNCWGFHDIICKFACWLSGNKCSNWQASHVIYDILKREAEYYKTHGRNRLGLKRKLESWFWFAFTFAFGGQKIKKENGWFRVKK